MTRDEFTAIGKKTDEELALLTTVELSALQATMAERDAAKAEPAVLKKQHAEAVAAKDAEKTAAIAAEQAKAAEAVAAKEARIAELKGYVDAVASEPKAIELAKQKRHDELLKKKAAAEAAAKKAQADLDAMGV